MDTPAPTIEPLEPLARFEDNVGPVYSLVWSPDGNVLAWANHGQVKLWDATAGAELDTLGGHASYVWGVAWSPDGSVLASASQDGTVRLWEATTYEELALLDTGWAFSVSWSPEGEQLAIGTSSGEVQIWNVESGEVLRTLSGTSLIISVGWSPDGRTIATGQWDGDIVLWDVASGRQLNVFTGYTSARCDTNGLAWSPDGNTLATAHQDGKVRLWAVGSGELLYILKGHSGWVRGVAWSPDGRRLASTGEDAIVRVWDVETGERLHTVSLRSRSLPVWSVAWSPDGSQLAAGSGTCDRQAPPGTIVVWAAKTPPATTQDVSSERVSFITEDGVNIAATLFGEGDIAVILLHHGVGNTSQMSWHPFAKLAAERGFAALTVDYRGRGRSEGNPSEPNILIRDARAAVEFLQGRGFERLVCIGSAKWGGVPCMRLALELDAMEGLVVLSNLMEVGLVGSLTEQELSQLALPKLFVYGERERDGIPEAMEQVYRLSPEPKEIVTYDSSARGTNLLRSPYGDDLRQRLLDFLEGLRSPEAFTSTS
jgi:WD40 repeat protein